MGLFEDAQRQKAERDAAQRYAAASAAEAAARAEYARVAGVEAQRWLLQQFVAEMRRLGVSPKKHRSTKSSSGYGGTEYYADTRIGVTGWSLDGCHGCDGGRSACGMVVGRDGSLYHLDSQPTSGQLRVFGVFMSPVKYEYPIQDLERQLTFALSHYL